MNAGSYTVYPGPRGNDLRSLVLSYCLHREAERNQLPVPVPLPRTSLLSLGVIVAAPEHNCSRGIAHCSGVSELIPALTTGVLGHYHQLRHSWAVWSPVDLHDEEQAQHVYRNELSSAFLQLPSYDSPSNRSSR